MMTPPKKLSKTLPQPTVRRSPLVFALSALLATAATAQTQSIDDLHFGPQQEQSGTRLDGVIAIVGNDVITAQEWRQQGGDKTTLERLIMEKLLLQAAEQRNIVIGDTALNIALDDYRKQGKSISREDLRRRLSIQKLQQKMANSLVNISDNEVDSLVEQQLQQIDDRVNLIDILVRVPETADAELLNRTQEKAQNLLAQLRQQTRSAGQSVGQSTAGQTDQQIAQAAGALYNDLGDVALSQIPATFAKALIDAPTNEFLPPIIDRDGIHLLKIVSRQSSQQTATAGLPETRVSHILIKDKNNPDAQSQIDDLYRQLQNGADFAELAQQYSQDIGSATKGGSLEWAYPGQMVPDFEAVMDATAIGQISQPFKSPFGYHILKVHERRQINQGSRDALAQKARRALFQKKASEAWELWLSQLRDEAYVEILQ